MLLLILLPVIATISYLPLAIFLARRKFKEKNIVLSRLSFAFQALFISQMGFLVVFISLLVLSKGFVLFVTTLLLFANVVVGLFTFLVALLVYRPFVQKFCNGDNKESRSV